VLGAAVALFLLLLAVASLKSYRDLETARGRERLLEGRIQQTETRIEQLHGRIDRLRQDPGALERLAREDLGMVRPGDLVLILPEGRPAAAPPTTLKAGSAGPSAQRPQGPQPAAGPPPSSGRRGPG
jgi:cell division protein FtsB